MRILLVLTMLVAALFWHLSSHLELRTLQAIAAPQSHEGSYRLPPGDILGTSSLNHLSAASDLVWVNGILYVSDEHLRRRSASQVTEFADAIIDLDPHFYPVYHWHSANRRLLNPHMGYEDVNEANRVLKRGIKHFPADWRIPFSVAANYLGTRYERSSEERLHDLEDLVHHAMLAAERPGAPEHVLLLATAYQRRLLRARAGIAEFTDEAVSASPEELSFLKRRFWQVSDPQMRQFLLHRLQELGAGDDVVRTLDQFERTFEQLHANRLGYTSMALFALVSPELLSFPEN